MPTSSRVFMVAVPSVSLLLGAFAAHDLAVTIIFANLVGASCAVAALAWTGTKGSEEVRGWAIAGIPAALYFVGLNAARLTYGHPLPHYWSHVTRGVALTAWVTVWIGLPLATVRARRRRHAALAEFQQQVAEMIEEKVTSTATAIRQVLPAE